MVEKTITEDTFIYEYQTGFYPIDIYFPDYRLAIEVDGSHHFYGLTDHRMAKSVSKYRIFDKLGINYRVIARHDVLDSGEIN
jgi:very-short-patch-repair endonuclease